MTTQDASRARAMLCNMPGAVFNDWLLPFIQDYGWPFRSFSDRTKGTLFENVLWGKEIYFWRNLHWRPMRKPLSEVILDPRSEELAQLIVSHVLGNDGVSVPIEKIEERFGRALRFVVDENKLPRPVVGVINDNAVIRLADGHHRIAAVLVVGQHKVINIDFWIGFQPRRLDETSNLL